MLDADIRSGTATILIDQKNALIMDDPWDPNNWESMLAQQDAREHRIYLHNSAQEWAIVDPIDYQWALQWCWCAKREPLGNAYARRAVGENANGMRLRTYTVYLHVAIMKRTGRRRPSKFHNMVDHRNGKSLDCRRANLRYATCTMNRHNRYLASSSDLIEDAIDGITVDVPF